MKKIDQFLISMGAVLIVVGVLILTRKEPVIQLQGKPSPPKTIEDFPEVRMQILKHHMRTFKPENFLKAVSNQINGQLFWKSKQPGQPSSIIGNIMYANQELPVQQMSFTQAGTPVLDGTGPTVVDADDIYSLINNGDGQALYDWLSTLYVLVELNNQDIANLSNYAVAIRNMEYDSPIDYLPQHLSTLVEIEDFTNVVYRNLPEDEDIIVQHFYPPNSEWMVCNGMMEEAKDLYYDLLENIFQYPDDEVLLPLEEGWEPNYDLLSLDKEDVASDISFQINRMWYLSYITKAMYDEVGWIEDIYFSN